MVEVVPSGTPANEKPSSRTFRQQRTERLNKQQEEARKALAASLSTAASAALAAESIKKSEEAEKKTERKKKAAKPGGEGRVGDIGPAVLTGTGEREHRNNLVWLGLVVGVVAAVVLLVFLLSIRSEERQALDAYAAPVEGERFRYPARQGAIQERAWLHGVPALIDAGRATFGPARAIRLSPARDALTALQGMTWIPSRRLWAGPFPEKHPDIETVWQARKDDAANLARLTELGIPVVTQDALRQRLSEALGGGDDVELVERLLIDSAHNGETPDWISRKLRAGEVPDAIELIPFTGREGAMLIDNGRSYRPRPVDYTGRLLRFVGSGWPGGWRVLDIRTSGKE